MTIIEAIREYQEPGAVSSFDPATATIQHGWKEHCPGTYSPQIGTILLGMPKGFSRLGPIDIGKIARSIFIFETFEEGWGYNMFNVPVWKYMDKHGNTLVRGLSPRVNTPFIHIFLGNHMDKINCIEITDADLEDMD